MKNQPNEMVMLEWLLPLFDEKLSQIFECWQNSKDNFEDVAKLLDTPENSKNILEMSKDEINDVLSRNLTNDEVTKEDIN